ncbi:hypothetical protein SAMN04490193_1798 [Pseudomonas marginalis]|nr:hypothetical protein SAMN04490193_1798 [Pseudomonas marginalis]
MLLERFCQDRKVDLTKLETFGNGEKLALVDQNISSAFVQYHRLYAELQPLLKATNVAKGGRHAGRIYGGGEEIDLR